jgi:predicted dehydrogenase
MSDKSSRRTWMASVGGATAAASFGTPLLQLNGAQNAPGRTLNVGVMGLNRGLALAKTLGKTPGVNLKYLAETDSERAEAGKAAIEKATMQTPTVVGDFRKMLDDKDLDILVVAAPNHWHAPATILGCAAGKHVYVEKPCSHNPWEGETMVEAARKHKRLVQMGNHRRSAASFQAAMQLLREGAIGRVYLSRSWYDNARGTIKTGQAVPVPAYLDYELWQGPAPRTAYYDNRIPYNWHWFWNWGNGELGNNGVHSIDISRWGLGVDYPIRVSSAGGRYAFKDDQETPDTNTVVFEFEGDRAITWEGKSCNKHGSDAFIGFYGTGGTMLLTEGGGYKLFDEKDKLVKEESGKWDLDHHISNFIEAVRNNEPKLLNSEILEGHKSTLLCHLGNISYRSGRVLNCRPSDGKIIGDDKAMALWKRTYEPGWEPKV